MINDCLLEFQEQIGESRTTPPVSPAAFSKRTDHILTTIREIPRRSEDPLDFFQNIA